MSPARRASSKSAKQPKNQQSGHPENLDYFTQKCYREWCLRDYLKCHYNPSSDNLSDTLRCWTQSLRVIAKCRVKTCCSRKMTAQARLLLKSFQPHNKHSIREIINSLGNDDGSTANLDDSTSNLGDSTSSIDGSTSNLDDSRCQSTALDSTENVEPSISASSQSKTDVSSTSDVQVSKEGVAAESTAEISKNGDQPASESTDQTTPINQDSIKSPIHHPVERASSESDSWSDSASEPPPAYVTSTNKYTSIQSTSKWPLPTGMMVEDLIHDACRHLTTNDGLLPEFIVDLSATTTQVHFTKIEIQEMKNAFPAMPLPNWTLLAIIKPYFAARSIEQLESARATLPSRNTDPSEDVNAMCRWVNLAVLSTCHLLMSRNNLLDSSQAEGWYNHNVWNAIIDGAFVSVPFIMLSRGELVCRASSMFLNRNRTSTGPENRQRIGPKLDGIIRSVGHDYYEFGAIEVAKDFNGTGATKWLEDGAKLRVVLRDMLVRLHGMVDDDSVRNVQTVGIICAGLKLQMVRCWAKKKGGAVFCMDEVRTHQFPKTFRELHKHLWLLMKAVDSARRIVVETMRVVERAGSPMTEEKFHSC